MLAFTNLSEQNSSHHLSIQFHEDFGRLFGMSVEDFENTKFNNKFPSGKIDKKYLGNMILHADV